jgi:hypothetical protein
MVRSRQRWTGLAGNSSPEIKPPGQQRTHYRAMCFTALSAAATSVHPGQLAKRLLRHFFVFPMDECLDRKRVPSPKHPYNFRTFYGDAFLRQHSPGMQVLTILNSGSCLQLWREVRRLDSAPMVLLPSAVGATDTLLTTGHVAILIVRLKAPGVGEVFPFVFGKQCRFPFWPGAHVGSAYQFVPPMSITLRIRECIGKKCQGYF